MPLIDFLVEGERTTDLRRRFASLRKRNIGNEFFLERLDRAHNTAKSFAIQLSEKIGESIEELVISL